ncbi:peptidoglycan DD-metalloendopeptidase family protein [Costertonia aggregata]|uniref:Peptidoglycan DD-metalloendopeptidase family protein n=1 Tax=Costertonia aggregata TaxID=343403 RepID=A0A7H9AT32_9FLAO|nr:peptidoglycan DD-metalloendopeptidase family protein [Costertonia aggregata]QLG46355.1 peptidoglycan DD-metalloendopeptidase family protein [Costertonia aggregata]
MQLHHIIESIQSTSIPILDTEICAKSYVPIDLSTSNTELKNLDITRPEVCQRYIDTVLLRTNGKVAFGGYLEHRNLYSDKSNFGSSGDAVRNIHLGIDFWCEAGTKVLVPLEGKVHSFQNNVAIGDYGPTIILEHTYNRISFYSLYGHLSVESLNGLFKGKVFRQGDFLATLGTVDINVNYAPHLHFQIIRDIQDKTGDYPGVCTSNTLEFYSQNCPNPNLLLKLKT